MTSNMNDHAHDHGRNTDEERELASVASRLLGAVPPRTPGTFPATGRCGWCSSSVDSHDAAGQAAVTELTREEDPAVWVLHVLREHLRDQLASCEMRVKFNAAGGATVEVFDAYVEDVALIRDTLGVQLLGVLDLPTSRGCVVVFGGDPYARQVSMVWYTWPRFLRLADQLNSAFWSTGQPGSTERDANGTTGADREPS
jgi:hypothetical protein